ncbi:MAG: hypothetical protein RL617_1294 [Pseudomonadota bacterium]|jgi:octaprenyl-diphosphate synthase
MVDPSSVQALADPAPRAPNAVQRGYEAILSAIESDMLAVDRQIRLRLSSEVGLVNQVADYIIGAGGKRVRPALVLMAARALASQPGLAAGGALLQPPPVKERPNQSVLGPGVIELAAIVEFIHTATLLHDDVVDESNLRRSRLTANAVFGNAASVLVGDFLYSRAFQMMVGLHSPSVMAVLADATNTIAEGEVLQLMNCQDPEVDEGRYLQVIRFKTAKLFEASACLPAVLAQAPEEMIEGLAAYGRHIGTAFQLTDDILDYSGDSESMGKQLGDDLREGKPTLPLIYLLQTGGPTDRALIRQAIIEPENAPVDAVICRVRESGALSYAKEMAQREVQLATDSLAHLEASPSKSSLIDLASFVIERRA